MRRKEGIDVKKVRGQKKGGKRKTRESEGTEEEEEQENKEY